MEIGSVFFGIGLGIILTIGYQKIKKYMENRQARYMVRYYSNKNMYRTGEDIFIRTENNNNNKINNINNLDNNQNKQKNKQTKSLLNLNNINGSITESDDNEYTEL